MACNEPGLRYNVHDISCILPDMLGGGTSMDKAKARAWLAEVIEDVAARKGGQSALARSLGRSRNTIAAWKSGANDPSWLDVIALCEYAGEMASSLETHRFATAVERMLVGSGGGKPELAARVSQLESRIAAMGQAGPVGLDFGAEMQGIMDAVAAQGKERGNEQEAGERRERSA